MLTGDDSNRRLSANPLLVKELLESFVGMDWVGRIDFSKAESLSFRLERSGMPESHV